MLGLSALSRWAKKKRSSDPRNGVLHSMQHIYNETAMQARTLVSKRLANANRASLGPRVTAKEMAKKTRENPKESPKEPKVQSKAPQAETRENIQN